MQVFPRILSGGIQPVRVSVKIRHENPSAQLSWKVRAPLFLETPNGDKIRIEAWSLAGFEMA